MEGNRGGEETASTFKNKRSKQLERFKACVRALRQKYNSVHEVSKNGGLIQLQNEGQEKHKEVKLEMNLKVEINVSGRHEWELREENLVTQYSRKE